MYSTRNTYSWLMYFSHSLKAGRVDSGNSLQWDNTCNLFKWTRSCGFLLTKKIKTQNDLTVLSIQICSHSSRSDALWNGASKSDSFSGLNKSMADGTWISSLALLQPLLYVLNIYTLKSISQSFPFLFPVLTVFLFFFE